jgi:CheY-like chemotaxis protein
MKRRILIVDPDPDVKALLELTVTKLGHETATHGDGRVDAVLMEPGYPVAHSLLRRFAHAMPPVVCLSIHPPESGLAPPNTVAYLMKPARSARLGSALALAFSA